MVSNETEILNRYNATQNKLNELKQIESQVSASYKPIEWFQMKHVCENPGLISNITPNETSTREWSPSQSKWCILDARNKCIKMYNETKQMPYFSIYKTSNGKMKWAIFKISDTEFNNKAIQNGDYSKIEVQQDNLVMNINFDKQQNVDLELDKHNIDIPNYYNIHDVNFNCIETVQTDVPDCNKIKQSKINACQVDKARAVVENEKKVERGLLDEARKLLGIEGFDSNKKHYKTLDKTSNEFIIKGGQKNKLISAIKDNQEVNKTLTNILNQKFQHFNEEKKNIANKYANIITGEKQAIKSEKNKLQSEVNSNNSSYKRNTNLKKIYNKKANYFNRKKGIAKRNSRRRFTTKRFTLEKWKRKGRRWKKISSKPTRKYRRSRKYAHCWRGRWWRIKCNHYRVRTRTRRVTDKSRTRRHRRYHKKWANRFAKYSKRFTRKARRAANKAVRHLKIVKSKTPKLNRAKYVSNKLEGFDNANRTCNNSSVNPNFKIHYANHNCTDENIFLNYPSENHRKTLMVDTPRSSQMRSDLISGYNNNPGSLNASVFVNDAGACNNKTNIKNQKIQLNYSINHKKEDIKITKLLIENRNGKITGNGMLFYNINGGTFEYILNNRSSNNNNVNIRLMNNGNLMMNDKIIIQNPVNNSNANIVNSYSVSNNKTTLNSGEEIRNAKYRLTLGNTYNGHSLYYKLNNTTGNTGVKDLWNNTFKYTESYHITNNSPDINVFILYKIKTHGLPNTQKFLYERRVYANIEKHDLTKCGSNLCYIRSISETLVGDIQLPGSNDNVNLGSIEVKMMDMFNDVRFKNKTINNNTLSTVDPDINDIRLALINSINNIHLGMQQVNANGFQGFTGRYEGFSNYSNIEGLKINTDGTHEDATGAVKDRLDLVDIIKDKDAAVQAKYDVISENAQKIRNKLHKLTGYADENENGIRNSINDTYDSKNNIIPFMFDASNGATDFYKTDTDSLDPQAKIDALKEDSEEMLFQQKMLYTIGSLTSATFLITAILLARNSR